ncbi:hypothetical protein [Mesorhizobium sp.]|uniref:hypothetical protein n=1 Tax=Mesorhizobium sp. TaxID=1871066 RepID=UPI00345C8DA7
MMAAGNNDDILPVVYLIGHWRGLPASRKVGLPNHLAGLDVMARSLLSVAAAMHVPVDIHFAEMKNALRPWL